jgi:hypothetical protein
MSRTICKLLLALAGVCASTLLVSAQAAQSPTENNQGPASTVANVYVSSSPSSGKGQINAYSAAANGALTKISGSPFAYNVNALALNSAWLFAVDSTDQVIDSFSIAPSGTLKLADTHTAELTGGGVVSLYLDHTGSSLYGEYYTTNNDYLQYSINQPTGALTYIGDLAGGPSNNSPLSFIGNNQFAYSSSCYHLTPSIYGVQRASDGRISYLSSAPPLPTAKSGDFYCPWLAAADPTNHLAVAVQPLTGSWANDGPSQLATYTADTSGNLTTSSTYTNMPAVLVGSVVDYRMSPSGKYLAVGGTAGLQIFHYNGPNPITKFTGLLTTQQVDQMFWDNANHLYAISSNAGKLYVFTVTSTGVKQAPGSPHSITTPENLIVLPKT